MLDAPPPDDPAESGFPTPASPDPNRPGSEFSEPDDLPTPIRPVEVRSILEATDRLGLHREAIVIPLAREGPGSVKRLAGGKIEITAPAAGDWNAWLAALSEALRTLGLASIRRMDPDEE